MGIDRLVHANGSTVLAHERAGDAELIVRINHDRVRHVTMGAIELDVD